MRFTVGGKGNLERQDPSECAGTPHSDVDTSITGLLDLGSHWGLEWWHARTLVVADYFDIVLSSSTGRPPVPDR